MIEFIKKIFKKWFGIFSLIASFSGLLLFYTGIDTNNLIVNLFKNNWLIISLIFLLISSYQVWLDTKKEKMVLENKLKNPIDYEIKAYKSNIHFDIHNIENNFDKKLKEITEEILNINKEIENLSNEPQKTNSLDSIFTMHNDKNLKSNEIYIREVKDYKKKLELYSKKKQDYLKKWKKFIDNDLKNIYFVDFTIKNIGTRADEDIDITITHQDKNITELNQIDNFPKEPLLPKKPSKKIINFIQNNENNLSQNLAKMAKLNRDSNPLAFRRFEKIDNNKFSIKLRDLKVSEKYSIFNRKFIMEIKNEDDFNAEIISKNSNSKINKKIIFEEVVQ